MKLNLNSEKSKRKYPQWVLGIFSVFLPLLLFILIEIILRIVNIGTPTKLFVKSNRLDGYLVMNPNVSSRYFVQQNATKGFYEEFKKVKNGNTIRIFVIGESTAVGFPYLNNVSFHRMLKYRLGHEFNDINFEIINLGLTAICSYSLLDFAPEIIKQKPDAIIIYAGHNEYVGAFGIGATNIYNHNRNITQLIIAFRKLRVTRLLEGFIQNLNGSNDALDGKNLMQRMAEKQRVEYGSKEYNAGIKQFRVNMLKLLSVFEKNQIPIFISELVANDKDLPPFINSGSQSISTDTLSILIDNTENEIKGGQFRKGIKLLKNAESVHSNHARIHYLLGRSYLEMQKYDSAYYHLIRAKDYDCLRFRAPEEFNSIIKEIAKEKEACFLPSKAVFESVSIGGIVGNELITEHVHPNMDGYFLLAKTIHDSLVASPFLKNKTRVPVDDDVFRLEMPVTVLDSLYGEYNIAMLKKEWPFFQKDNFVYPTHDDLKATLALKVLHNEKNWLEAVDEIYTDAVQKNDHKTALKIAEALHLEFPYDFRFLEKSAKHSMAIGLFKKGAHYFKKSFELTSVNEYAKEAMIAYLKCDEPGIAINFIPTLMKINGEVELYQHMRTMIQEIINYKLTLKSNDFQVTPRILIAQNYYLMGNFEVAEIYALEVLEQDSLNSEANKLIENISKYKASKL